LTRYRGQRQRGSGFTVFPRPLLCKTALEVLSERGLSISPRGDQLAVGPNRLLSQDFAGKLREFKPALLPLLQTKGITWIEVHSERLGEDDLLLPG